MQHSEVCALKSPYFQPTPCTCINACLSQRIEVRLAISMMMYYCFHRNITIIRKINELKFIIQCIWINIVLFLSLNVAVDFLAVITKSSTLFLTHVIHLPHPAWLFWATGVLWRRRVHPSLAPVASIQHNDSNHFTIANTCVRIIDV